MTDRAVSETNASQRLDKWLWYARLVKSRSLAGHIVESGNIRVNRQRVVKASACVRRGDIITATLNNRVVVIEVLALGERRGPASEAQTLYKIVDTPAISPDPAATPHPREV